MILEFGKQLKNMFYMSIFQQKIDSEDNFDRQNIRVMGFS